MSAALEALMARSANTKGVDAAVMARLRAPFGCEFIYGADDKSNRWRIHDANDDAIASVSGREEGYARLIVAALNREFDRRKPAPVSGSPEEMAQLHARHHYGPGSSAGQDALVQDWSELRRQVADLRSMLGGLALMIKHKSCCDGEDARTTPEAKSAVELALATVKRTGGR